MLDCLIIGGGPAGLTAAIYLARYRRKVLVIDAGKSRAALIPESHNYPGFHGIAGETLLKRLREQAAHYGATLETGTVTSLTRAKDSFAAIAGGMVEARMVLIATGLVDHRPPTAGLQEGLAHGTIRYCPICDGYEATDKRVGVLGPFAQAGSKALFMRTYTRDVTLFPTDGERGKDLDAQLAEAGVNVAAQPERVAADSDGVTVTAGGKAHALDMLYPAMGCDVQSDLAVALGADCTGIGNVHVNDSQRTSVQGLYGAGDVVSDLHQLAVATGHAAIAATEIHNRLARNMR